ncbi:ChaB family protein [Alsobacter sp. SYSU M60028]|uniref:ChaB family protein n=1 Tax=Alsobacter ponti TaxID=2962936 RepID=A0ABT1LFB9_9HYPH|nr:ChaB family protein [Alsobacter ponti]MCP8940119.1 ChaB family protein [Alsobacter ponti]
MPYDAPEDLPERVRAHLPWRAQDIFVAAFNHAWRDHADDPEREAIAFRIAWSAVKKRYRKVGERWIAIAEDGLPSREPD